MKNYNTPDWLHFDETTIMIRNHIHAKPSDKAFFCEHIRVDKSGQEEHEITTSKLVIAWLCIVIDPETASVLQENSQSIKF